MDDLVRQVRRARRRMAWQKFFACLPWCWLAAFIAAVAVIVADRFALAGFQPAEKLADWAGWEESRTATQVSWLFFGVSSGAAVARLPRSK